MMALAMLPPPMKAMTGRVEAEAGAEVVLMVGQQSGRATMVARVPQACRLPLRFAVGFMMLKRGYCTAVGLHAQVMQP